MVNLEMGDMPENGVNQDEVAVNDKLKFVNGSSEDIKSNKIEPITGKNFAGLTKTELLQYADDPFWVKLRSALLLLFWVVWFGMLGTAILIIVLSPKCPTRPETNFLDGAAVYEVDGSFVNDANKLSGIARKFDYIKETVKSKVLVVDNDLIENLNELKTFVKNAHKKEIKIVIAVRAVQNITEELKKIISSKIDGIKLTGSNNNSAAQLNAMLKSKETSFGKYNTKFIAEKALGIDPTYVDMTIEKRHSSSFNINHQSEAFSIVFDSNVDMKLFMLNAMSQRGTPFIKAGQELGKIGMDWEELEIQQAIGAGFTNVDLFSQLNALREEEAMMFGELIVNNDKNANDIISFTRKAPGFPSFYVAANFDSGKGIVNFGNNTITGVVVANTGKITEMAVGTIITFGNILLDSGQGVIIKCNKKP